MQLANGIQLNLQPNSSQKDISFRSGQIIYGKVYKIYPNQTAEVQIGGTRITAALDAPLQAGEKYWLQVQPGEGTIRLKLLPLPSRQEAASLKTAADQLISHLGMPQNKESLDLARFLLRNQLPITKDTFQAALDWIKASDASIQQGMNTVKTMHLQGLPFIKDVFQALLSIEKGQPFHTLLAGLVEQLNKSGEPTETALQIRKLIGEQLQPEKSQIGSKAFRSLIHAWASENAPLVQQQSAYRILQTAGIIDKNITELEFAESLIQKAHVFSSGTKQSSRVAQGLALIAQYMHAIKQNNQSLANQALEAFRQLLNEAGNPNSDAAQSSGGVIGKPLIEPDNGEVIMTPAHGLPRPEGKAATAGQPIGGAGALQADQVIRMVKQLIIACTAAYKGTSASIADQGQALDQLETMFASLHGRETISKVIEDLADMLVNHSKPAARENGIASMALQDRELLKALADAEWRNTDYSKGTYVSEFIQKLSKSLGLNLESYLAASFGKEENASSEDLLSLKPMLLKLLNENQPMTVKEAAEQVLHRITAQQLLSNDAGPLQNLVMQIPLTMANHRTDLTLQWSGRKKSDGTIDPGYCRILFYLKLAQIKETVIDMQIQNKVIKVTVYNEAADQLKPLSNAFLPLLKRNVEEMGYKLSSVGFESEATRKNPVSRQPSPLSIHSDSYSGVDLRI
ncbi:hypothetical protein CVD28_16415 [Bacillus sp. M6-12]|uniref:hypothetical protein n=1 Tax=Bacillus sp. M6-12 TaxID=2054166 RepID=UPI000C77C50F|nr:hypothetical protein [Bacillus sp. M6-12]PLS16659.1 hypothetical protein CVD28_16415 [Bacillus sp. M6-12]